MSRPGEAPDTFEAVADPQRRQLLDLLRGGERSVGDLAGAAGRRQPQVSKQLKVLRGAGLVQVRAAGQERYYRLDRAGLAPLRSWVDALSAQWPAGLDHLAPPLEPLDAPPLPPEPPAFPEAHPHEPADESAAPGSPP